MTTTRLEAVTSADRRSAIPVQLTAARRSDDVGDQREEAVVPGLAQRSTPTEPLVRVRLRGVGALLASPRRCLYACGGPPTDEPLPSPFACSRWRRDRLHSGAIVSGASVRVANAMAST
jgi:hypothetical protein